MKSARWTVGLVLGFGLLGGLVGCGGSGRPESKIPAQPVKGKVLLGDQPLSGGRLSLTLVSNNDKHGNAEAGADIQADGTFEPRQVGDKPGLVPGRWKVVVSPVGGYKDGKAVRIKETIPAKYTNANTTDLFLDVQEGENTPSLVLK